MKSFSYFGETAIIDKGFLDGVLTLFILEVVSQIRKLLIVCK